MNRGSSAARLTLVKGRPCYDPREPEQALSFIFAEEARILGELRQVRDQLPAARQRYAAKHNLLILPGFPTLRRLFG